MSEIEIEPQHIPPPDTEEYTWDDAKEDCIDASSTVGDAVGELYEYGANRATGGTAPEAAEEIGDTIGGFVEKNWEEVCNLPETISDVMTDIFSDSEIEPVSPHDDMSTNINVVDDPIDAIESSQSFNQTDSGSYTGIEDASVNTSVDFALM